MQIAVVETESAKKGAEKHNAATVVGSFQCHGCLRFGLHFSFLEL